MVPSITLTNPGTQTSYDGDAINLSLTSRNSASNAMSYSETNLPPGLSVGAGSYSAGTGHAIISGTISSNADQGGPYSVTITATDTTTLTQGGQSFTWKIIQPTLTLTQPKDQTNCDGDTVSLPVAASENASHTLTYTESGLPTGLSINQSTGFISGTIGSNDVLQGYSVTVTANDGAAGLTASKTFNWTLVPIEAVLSNPGDQSNYDGDPVSLTIAAKTTYASAGVFTFSISGLPPGLSFNSGTTVISGTIASNADQDNPYGVTASVTDTSAQLTSTRDFGWTVTNPVNLANPLDHDNLDGDTVSVPIYATDSAGHSLSYSATGLPNGASINSSTGVISGELGSTDDASSPSSVTVKATDSAGASASITFSWEIDPLVTVLNPGDQSNCEGDSVSLAVQAFDSAGNTLTYSASNLPSGLSIDSSSGIISGMVTGAEEGTPYSAIVTATDGGIAVSQSFRWSIVPINIFNPGDQSSLDGDTVSLALKGAASDPGTDTFAYSANVLPDGLTLNTATGLISGTVADDAGASNPYTITVTCTDQTAGISASQTFTWCVQAPASYDLTLGTTPNTPITEIDLTQNSNSPDDPSMTTSIVYGPSHGSLMENDDGTYTYTSTDGFIGTDTFTFTVINGDLTSNAATATITVAADVPTIGGNLSYTDLPGQALTLTNLLGNASDPDGAPLSVQIVSGPSNGALSLSDAGVEVYTPNSGFTGLDSFAYQVSNGTDTSTTATVSINVESQPLVANTLVVQATGEAVVSPSMLLTNAASLSGNPVWSISFTNPSNGTLVVDRGGNIDYTPNTGFAGTDSYSCTVSDGTNQATEAVQVQTPGGAAQNQEATRAVVRIPNPLTFRQGQTPPVFMLVDIDAGYPNMPVSLRIGGIEGNEVPYSLTSGGAILNQATTRIRTPANSNTVRVWVPVDSLPTGVGFFQAGYPGVGGLAPNPGANRPRISLRSPAITVRAP